MGTSIEKIYRELFGDLPLREGEALERLSAIICKMLNVSSDVRHDTRIRGLISRSLYQVDVEERTATSHAVGEAKDYEERQAPVGRPDVQKLAAALPDIGADLGKFFSSTGFTKPARQYAEAAEAIIGRRIELTEIRPFVQRDLDGRLERIILSIHLVYPDWDSPYGLLPKISAHASAQLRDACGPGVKIGDTFKIIVDKFFDERGCEILTVPDLTRRCVGALTTNSRECLGSSHFQITI